MAETDTTPKAKGGVEDMLEGYLVKKAPFQIPAAGREFVVKAAPWVDLILLILMLPAILAVFAVGSLLGSVAPAVGAPVGLLYWVALLILLVQAIVMGVALPGLFKRKRSAWKLLYWATLVSFGYGAVNWLSSPAAFLGLVWTAITTVISLYVLFQVRDYYKA